jgi:RNA polymerase sigma factor (sigma-70 family)
MLNKPTFEESIGIIDNEIFKRRGKWHLTAISGWLDFDDLSQILRIHIFKKWHLYNPDLPLKNWLNRIISNQIKNLLRNLHSNYAIPCNRCPCNIGDNMCSLFGEISNKCPLVAKWEKSKKHAYNVKLPLYLENHLQEVSDRPNKEYDVEQVAPLLHEKMEEVLKPLDFKIYKLLFIENKSEEEVVKNLGYKNTDSGKSAGLKTIRESKKTIMLTARIVLANKEIDLPY